LRYKHLQPQDTNHCNYGHSTTPAPIHAIFLQIAQLVSIDFQNRDWFTLLTKVLDNAMTNFNHYGFEVGFAEALQRSQPSWRRISSIDGGVRDSLC
jgi:hypothetical protein